MSSPVYLDWNATTPPHPDVLRAMAEAAAHGWANPSSVHNLGRAARALVEDAREAVGALLGFHPRDVLFTSGGTEANNMALRLARAPSQRPLIVGRLEHPSVTKAAEALASEGVGVTWVDADASGVVPTERFRQALAAQPGCAPLVALQAVNHETGVVQPVAAVAELVHAAGGLLFVDAIQAVGKLPASTWEGADMVSFAAHKVRGPKGIGALATRPGLRLPALLRGGAQERGLRPGTQDGVACAGVRVAAERARTGPERYARLAELRDAFERDLVALAAQAGTQAHVNGSAPRAPHVTNLSWSGWESAELAAALDLAGVCVASGAACSAGTAEASVVIRAMLGAERARSALRVSLGEETSRELLETALSRWKTVVLRRGGGS